MCAATCGSPSTHQQAAPQRLPQWENVETDTAWPAQLSWRLLLVGLGLIPGRDGPSRATSACRPAACAQPATQHGPHPPAPVKPPFGPCHLQDNMSVFLLCLCPPPCPTANHTTHLPTPSRSCCKSPTMFAFLVVSCPPPNLTPPSQPPPHAGHAASHRVCLPGRHRERSAADALPAVRAAPGGGRVEGEQGCRWDTHCMQPRALEGGDRWQPLLAGGPGLGLKPSSELTTLRCWCKAVCHAAASSSSSSKPHSPCHPSPPHNGHTAHCLAPCWRPQTTWPSQPPPTITHPPLAEAARCAVQCHAGAR